MGVTGDIFRLTSVKGVVVSEDLAFSWVVHDHPTQFGKNPLVMLYFLESVFLDFFILYFWYDKTRNFKIMYGNSWFLGNIQNSENLL